MTLTVNSKDILKAVQTVGSLIKSPSSMPILDTVLFKLENNNLELVADNLEVRSTINIPINFEGTYAVCIPYVLLVNILKGFPNGPVDFIFQEKSVILKSTGEYKIPIEKADEFPKSKIESAGEVINFNSIELIDAIRKASTFVDNGNNLSPMSNVLVWINETDTKVTGGTGHVVYESTLPITGPEKKLLLSRSVVTYLIASIDIEEVLSVSYIDNQVFFTLENRIISAVLSNLEYPKYENLFGKIVSDKKYNVNKDNLVPPLKRILNITDKNSFSVKFSFSKDKLHLAFHHSMQDLNANEEIACEYEGEDFKIGFNASHLNNILSLTGGDIVIAMQKTNDKACFITGNQTRCILAPMMIPN